MTVETRVHRLPGGVLTFERWQDCEDIVERNKALQNEPQRGEFRHVGSIPNVILEKWMNEFQVNLLGLHSTEFAAFIKRKLNEPEWKWLKTTDGRI